MLKKEFKEKDVQRLRNLITGKYGNKTQVGVGYSKEEKQYKEGDIWEENGRKWTIKNGVKQNITKLDKAKKYSVLPIFCPSCSQPLLPYRDKAYYNIHKKCLNCVVDFEHELRKAGLFEEYQTRIHNSDIDYFITDFKTWINAKLKEDTSSFISENGEIENWVGGPNKKRVLEELDKTIKYLDSLKK